jgi:hypothetical protein
MAADKNRWIINLRSNQAEEETMKRLDRALQA